MQILLTIIAILTSALAVLAYKYIKLRKRLRAFEGNPSRAAADEGIGAMPEKDAATATRADSRGKACMMLVGLDRQTVSTLQENLSGEFTFSIVTDSRDAVKQATEQNPDIIISDYLMPGITGDVLCHQLKSQLTTSHIPVVFLTALSDSSDIIYGLEAGASDYITKPFETNVLRARINKVLAQQQMVRKDVVEASLDSQENEGIDYTSAIDRKFMVRVNDILASKIDNFEFSTNDLYRELGMSRTVVYNKLKALTGHAPSDYIRIIRLNKAMELLKTREFNVSEVAFKVGYADPKYFSTSFKKQFGMSPSKV